MTRFTSLTLAAMLSLAPTLSFAANPGAATCTPAQAAAAQLSSSGLSCAQWVAQFAPNQDNGQAQTQTAHNDRAATPHS